MAVRGFVWIGCLLLLQGEAASGGAADAPSVPTVPLRVELELAASAKLSVKDIKFSIFPGGRRCAFIYGGPKQPKTIEFMTKLGFGTTLYLSPGTDPKYVQALEDAGAEIAVHPWQGKANYQSNIGANTVQEAYDGLVSSRLVLGKKMKRALMVGYGGGHMSPSHWPVTRNMEEKSGYGAAYLDSHYLTIVDPSHPYMFYLGYGRPTPLMVRGKSQNTMDSRRVPNELIYYQMLAAQFRGTLRRASKGQVVLFSIRDFKAPDLEDLKDAIGEYGQHPDIWNASDGKIGAYEVLKKKSRVLAVKTKSSNKLEITLGLEADLFPPFLVAPLSLKLPKDIAVKAARVAGLSCVVTKRSQSVHVDLPIREALSRGCEMKLQTAAPDLRDEGDADASKHAGKTAGGSAFALGRKPWLRQECGPDRQRRRCAFHAGAKRRTENRGHHQDRARIALRTAARRGHLAGKGGRPRAAFHGRVRGHRGAGAARGHGTL